jgi:cyanophycinase
VLESNPPPAAGTLMMIGGAEDKQGERRILAEVARRASGAPLVIATLASEEPEYQCGAYCRLFRDLGVADVRMLNAETREDLAREDVISLLDGAGTVFFTGGDQLKITTKLGGTAALDRIRALYEQQGGLVAGTSAGAAALGELMLMSSHAEGTEKHKVRRAFIMAHGLGLIRDMVIDQHFAQRARIERLLGALAENPSVLGVGIDEDTAIVVRGREFQVIGSGAVYVADGSSITYTNVSEQASENTLCLCNVTLHVLNHNSRFDMAARAPIPATSGSDSRRPV